MKTLGQLDYEADVKRRPTYDDGSPRRPWHELPALFRWTWERPHGTKLEQVPKDAHRGE